MSIVRSVLSVVLLMGMPSAVAFAADRPVEVFLAVCDRGVDQHCDAPVAVRASRIVVVLAAPEGEEATTDVMIEFAPAGREALAKLSKKAWDSQRSLAIIQCDGEIANAWIFTEPDYSPGRLSFEWKGDGFSLTDIMCPMPPIVRETIME